MLADISLSEILIFLVSNTSLRIAGGGEYYQT
jgi:hypothetical protein